MGWRKFKANSQFSLLLSIEKWRHQKRLLISFLNVRWAAVGRRMAVPFALSAWYYAGIDSSHHKIKIFHQLGNPAYEQYLWCAAYLERDLCKEIFVKIPVKIHP